MKWAQCVYKETQIEMFFVLTLKIHSTESQFKILWPSGAADCHFLLLMEHFEEPNIKKTLNNSCYECPQNGFPVVNTFNDA